MNPSEFWKTVEHIALIASIVGVLIAWLVARRKKERRKIEPDPLRVRKYQERAKEETCKERYEWAMEAIEALSKANDDEHRRIHDSVRGVEKGLQGSLDGKLSKILEEIPEMERRLNDKGEERSGNIHDRINEILEDVGQIRGELNQAAKERKDRKL